MAFLTLILYLAAFAVLSFGSSLIVGTISSFAKRLKVSHFMFSFFIGGLLTSVAEVAVAINATTVGKPELFVGSMLGGTLVIFLLVIPLMTLLTGGLPVGKHLTDHRLAAVLAIIAAPSLVALDRRISAAEALGLIGLYGLMFFIIRGQEKPAPRLERPPKTTAKIWRQNIFLRLLAGTVLIFISSRFIVEQTVVYAEALNVSAFIIGLIVLAIGTNLPEFAVAFKAAQSHELKAMDIAIGDFLGSAATNVLLFGIFTLINQGQVVTSEHFTATFLCTLLAVVSFFAFTRGKSILTVRESRVLLAVYLLFIVTQFLSD